jgi:hypothetical protein
MSLLAEESCAGPAFRARLEAGHDVLATAQVAIGAADEQVLKRALDDRRVFITEDGDSGELVYARGQFSGGVILVRFHSRAPGAKRETVVEAVTKLGSRLQSAFTVVEPGRIRISGRP